MPIYAIDEISPRFAEPGSVFVAPDATLIGRVEIGRRVGIWFGAVLRGDQEPIVIGDDSNIQEHVVMHTDPGFPATVGTGCTIGHKAILHGCTIGDNVLIGMGATILNRAVIGDGCLVGAGALVTEGKVFEPGSLIVGSPAKAIRTLDEQALAALKISAAGYVSKARTFAERLTVVG